MKTNVGLTDPSLLNSVVFKEDFNHFEKIRATQAWSLLLTGGRGDKALGTSPMVGRFLNFSLIAIAGTVWIVLFQSF
jgi:hypothetical protein